MSFAEYIKESFTEFRSKVEWPKWADLQESTTIVAVSTIVLSIFTFGIDEVFAKALKNIIGILINAVN